MKTKTKSLRAPIALLMCYFCYAEGAYFTPIAYTLPNGLSSVNGSSSTGGCQPGNCIMMPISGTAINGCSCPSNIPVNGSLIDGVIPSIDTTQRGTWANALFTVNRNGQDSIMIGFSFLSEFSLRGIKVVLFHCPVQGIGITGVNVYSSFVFPDFITAASALLVTQIFPPREDCQSLSTISVSVQPPMIPSNNYFIKFLFTDGSSVNQVNWLYLGEIRFSDETLTMPPTAMTETTTENEAMTTTTLSEQTTTTATTTTTTTTAPTTITTTTTIATTITTTAAATTGYSPPTSSFSTESNTHENVSITRDMNNDTAQPSIAIDISSTTSLNSTQSNVPTTMTENDSITDDINNATPQPSVATAFSYVYVSDIISSITTPIQVVTTSKLEAITQEGSNPTTITVAALAGIIGILILLMIGCCALFLCFACYRKHKSSLLDIPQNQYALPTELTLYEKGSSLPTSTNSCYNHGKRSANMTLELPDPLSTYCNPEIYSELDGDSGLYDDIGENHYALISETIKTSTTNGDAGKSIDVSLTANNTINQDKQYASFESENLRQPIDDETALSVYSQVGENTQVVQEGEYYTDMQGSRAASQLSICSRHSSCYSGPLLQLSKPLCHTMEDNPTYNSAWSLLEDNEKQELEEGTYADPDARLHRSQLTIYETVYSDSLVKPSIFKQNDTPKQNNSGVVKQDGTIESGKEEGEKKATLMYSPIYLSYEALSPTTSQKQPIAVTNDSIRGIKVLGTGFFGKVVLADTVGLSLKDLGLSETDDDKNVSIRVAVKKLKLNASKSTRDAFEKECRFMSRLDHPNVIRMLGMCNTDPSQFIIMEYMEKGDLNGYLEWYESIIHGQRVPKERDIHVNTLVYMCTQIAAAMNYLVSRNFIHRDLAARNCLVGDKNVIKLADFGMSRNLYESHYYMVRGNAVMPVRWMASECFYGKFSAKTDVWAFGVTMWEIFMLAKDRPYSDMEDMEVVNDAIEKEERTLLQQPDHCPDNVFEIMMRCWAKNPKDRATFEELHTMLIQNNESF